MRVEGKERGVIETGFARVSDGWHIMRFEEGIDYLQKDGEALRTKKGDLKWKIPMVVDDENDDDNGVKYDALTQETMRGEELIASMLAATGLWDKFVKAFSGDESIFDEKVISKVKTQLPGQYWRVKTEEGKPGKDQEHGFINIVGYGKMSDKIEDLEELFGGKKGGGKKEEKKQQESKKSDDDDWA